MPITVNMHEAKTHLSKLVARAEEGEEIVIARAGKPVVSLKRWIVPTPKKRVLGTAKGKVEIAADFDEPIPGFEEFYE